MTIPPYIKTGDTVAIVAPAGKVDASNIERAVSLLQSKGFKVVLGDHLFDNHFRFSATDNDRLADLQSALDDPKVKAIFCARGGYGTSVILDNIRFQEFIKHPKWIVGFSDITALLCKVNQLGFAAIHGPVANQWSVIDQNSVDCLFKMLKGESVTYQVESEHSPTNIKLNSSPVGGNLSLITHLVGTNTLPDFAGKILFLEEINEPMYKIDRMMLQLKRAGLLSSISGFIGGHFSGIEDEYDLGINCTQLLQSHLPKDIPMIFNFPSGHEQTNLPLILGKEVTVDLIGQQSTLSFL